MSDQKIATERVFQTGQDGVERLVAAPGDPIPDDDDAPVLGYREMIDLRADTADAALAKGEPLPAHARSQTTTATFVGADEENYAPPIPKPGEDGYGEAESKAAKQKAKRSSDGVEDKAKRNT